MAHPLVCGRILSTNGVPFASVFHGAVRSRDCVVLHTVQCITTESMVLAGCDRFRHNGEVIVTSDDSFRSGHNLLEKQLRSVYTNYSHSSHSATIPHTHWQGLLQGKFKIPRHGFILWLAFLENSPPWINHEDSAPGPDGYTSAFFKSAWPVIGQAVSVAVATFSVTLNGSVHGFFKSSRGLRQGDPLSPYLFVLVMEIWSTLIRYRVQHASHFQYHWKCKEIGLTNLCFADDVLLFCKVDLLSVQVLKEALSEFAALSGLKVNPAKSQIILSRAVQTRTTTDY
ncbi:UNVERIFIED_CONTAM: putative mitochondrial protein [Sesamum calycinum]|uniref:Mitochondrial protein n=1 Tax=Sesamum calycinum TaxID=2727403 RepID=A0AAW2K1B6_9LAMI